MAAPAAPAGHEATVSWVQQQHLWSLPIKTLNNTVVWQMTESMWGFVEHSTYLSNIFSVCEAHVLLAGGAESKDNNHKIILPGIKLFTALQCHDSWSCNFIFFFSENEA